MYVIITTTTADRDQIAAASGDHGAWLDQQRADGVLLLAGRQEPRVGGVVLVADIDREELDRRLAEEPYAQRGLATHNVVRFTPSRASQALESLLES